MKTTLLSTVAAAALAMSFGLANAQYEKGGASGGAMERSAPAGGMERGAAGEREQPSKGGPSTQAQTPSGSSKSDMNVQKDQKDSSQKRDAQSPATSDKMGSDKAGDSMQKAGDPKQKTTVGAAPSSETRLTTEQRTQIREKVVATGPKVNNVNFSLSVGTVVPRTVQVAEVPSVIVDIHPEWRGYRYFVVNNQVIIVERDSLKIVAVLPV